MDSDSVGLVAKPTPRPPFQTLYLTAQASCTWAAAGIYHMVRTAVHSRVQSEQPRPTRVAHRHVHEGQMPPRSLSAALQELTAAASRRGAPVPCRQTGQEVA